MLKGENDQIGQDCRLAEVIGKGFWIFAISYIIISDFGERSLKWEDRIEAVCLKEKGVNGKGNDRE